MSSTTTTAVTSNKSKGPLPLTRVHTIMKSSSDAEMISKEAAQIMSKAAELFIKLLSEDSYKLMTSGKKLDYEHLSEVVHNDERYEFLRDMVPKKITVLEYKRILDKLKEEKKGQNEAAADDDDEEEDGEDNQESSSGDEEDSSSSSVEVINE